MTGGVTEVQTAVSDTVRFDWTAAHLAYSGVQKQIQQGIHILFPTLMILCKCRIGIFSNAIILRIFRRIFKRVNYNQLRLLISLSSFKISTNYRGLKTDFLLVSGEFILPC